ncbi:glutamine-hydrolyzing carbamoyl-phosphate synthase small subunit [Bartonella sp. DGB1]|uniref:glutamine-hydrolyzing carbamoyl-phosphate synthase small subunit n=1 Tax=Bartonella sp. DGB1 TaxID=3239807 RepID=UPI003526BC28
MSHNLSHLPPSHNNACTSSNNSNVWSIKQPTAVIVFEDGNIIYGNGFGATGTIEGEICFNTAMTGYQEILTDPSYSGQIINFTFPHIGIVGTNNEDIEDLTPETKFGAVGAIFKADITSPSNYRSNNNFNEWLKKRNIIALSDVDTRSITSYIRDKGAKNVVISHNPDGIFNIEKLLNKAKQWSGLNGVDLAKAVSNCNSPSWLETSWQWPYGYGTQKEHNYNVVVIDYGIKRNILRLLCDIGAKVTIVSAQTSAADILALNPDGIFLSNGPGDPSATGIYSIAILQELLTTKIPIFGICLGHQLLALATGAKTIKMHQGHHGSNHPVKDYTTGKVEIVSMNHGFAVDSKSLPNNVKETHISLFDGTNCGIALLDSPAFSVQHHPEASPGPQDSHYLFRRFSQLMNEYKNKKAIK